MKCSINMTFQVETPIAFKDDRACRILPSCTIVDSVKKLPASPRRISAVSGLLKLIVRAGIFCPEIAVFQLIGVLNSVFYFPPWGDTSGG